MATPVTRLDRIIKTIVRTGGCMSGMGLGRKASAGLFSNLNASRLAKSVEANGGLPLLR